MGCEYALRGETMMPTHQKMKPVHLKMMPVRSLPLTRPGTDADTE